MDNIRRWMASLTQEEYPHTENWYRFIDLVQMEFREGRLLDKCTWNMFVLIPKGNGEFRGIGLVEVLWNTVSGMINCRIVLAVQFHDVIHCFWMVQGTNTAPLEANMLQNMTEIREEFL